MSYLPEEPATELERLAMARPKPRQRELKPQPKIPKIWHLTPEEWRAKFEIWMKVKCPGSR